MTYGRNKAISATAVPPKKIQPATATAVLSFFFFLFLFFLLYSLLFSWLMVRLWFGFRALPEGVSELLVSQIKSYFPPLFFACFFHRILLGFILQNKVRIHHPIRTSELCKKNEITEKVGVAEKEFRHIANLISGLVEHMGKVRHQHEVVRIR